MHEHHRLDQFDVAVLRVPVNVGRAHEQRLVDLRRIRPDAVAPGRLLRLEQSGQSDVVLGHDPVQHVVRSFRVRHRQLVEFDQMFENQRKPAAEKKIPKLIQ